MRKFPGLVIGIGLFLFACANDYDMSKLEKAARKGDIRAQVALGFSQNEKNIISSQNNEKIIELFSKSAELGNTDAQVFLGTAYSKLGGAQDYQKAYYWFEQAAKDNNAKAFYGIGVLYHDGLGVQQDFYKARRLYEKASELGDIDAKYNLANMYANGEGVEQDYEKAFQLWSQVSEQGGADAMYNLAMMYASGNGVDVSYKHAIKLFKSSCDKGKDEACQVLKQL